MNINKILLVLLLSFFVSFQGYSQLKKANTQFEFFRYSKAIPLYQKVLNSDDNREVVIAVQRLADCYRLINDVPKASVWYKKAIELASVDAINFWYLGQSLRSLEKYGEAANAFEKYARLVPEDPKGELFHRFCVEILEWDSLVNVAEIKNIESINTKYSEFSPSLFNNGIVFTSDRQTDVLDKRTYGWTNFNYLDLYFSEPDYFSNHWKSFSEPVSLLGNFNQSFHDGPACFSNDGNQVFVTKTITDRGRKESSKLRTHLLKIFYAGISDGKIMKYKPFRFNSKEYSVGHAALSPNNNQIVFSSDMPNGFGSSDLYISEFENGEWQKPVSLGANVNSRGDEVFPYFMNDSTIYFSSDGHLGYGGLDIFVTFFKNQNWGKPENIKKPINSSFDDFGIIFTRGNSDGLFSSNRPEGKGFDDIYAFRSFKHRPQENMPVVDNSVLMMAGTVKSRNNSKPLKDATVFVLNTITNKVLVLKSDDKGVYKAPVGKNTHYIVKALKSGYIEDCTSFRTPDDEQVTDYNVPNDLLLGRLEADMVFKVENIYYDLDKYFIREDAVLALRNLASILNKYPINVELSSHTDSRATFEYNLDLSEKRAEAAVRYLIMLGVKPSKLVAKGYGESKLVNKCADGVVCTETEHQQNRRTEFKILSVDYSKMSNLDSGLLLFKQGDELDARLLGQDFFANCIGDNNTNAGNVLDRFFKKTKQYEGKADEKVEPPIPVIIKNTVKLIESKPEPKIEKKKVVEVIKPRVEKKKDVVAEADKIIKVEAVTEIETNSDVWYGIQISFNKQKKATEWYNYKGEKGIYEIKEGMFYRIFTGKFKNLQKAQKELERLKEKFIDAYVVQFENNKPEAIK